MSNKYDNLREKALVNFELLLEYWQIEYKYLGNDEYDIIAPNRIDHNFGACRFNIRKGRGADFAGTNLKDSDFASFGVGFGRDDFSSTSSGSFIKSSFDIIGFCGRVHNSVSYQYAAQQLRSDLEEISKGKILVQPLRDAAERRRAEQEAKDIKKSELARELWRISERIKFKGSLGDRYLQIRGINIDNESSIRFLPKMRHPSGEHYPGLMFKVSKSPEDKLVAIHRIFLEHDGTTKAPVDDPKMALARIQGSGIWFGEPDETLYILEGPEEALTVYYLNKFRFVVSTVFATNFHSLSIPDYVKNVVLIPDEDEAGLLSLKKAVQAYRHPQRRLIRLSVARELVA